VCLWVVGGGGVCGGGGGCSGGVCEVVEFIYIHTTNNVFH
jgi:hypothetical protein